MPRQIAERHMIAGVERVEKSIAQHRRGTAGPGRCACGHDPAPLIGKTRVESWSVIELHISRLYTLLGRVLRKPPKNDLTRGRDTCTTQVQVPQANCQSLVAAHAALLGLSLSLDVPAPGVSPSFHHYRKSRHGYRYSKMVQRRQGLWFH